MCTLVILRRPGNAWPLILAGNRDEMASRPTSPPARHWSDRPEIVAGLDRQAGGSWMGLNDQGVAAVVMNRDGTLGQAAGKKSRGELVLLGLSFASARSAADALASLPPGEYRPFNLVVADASQGYLLRLIDGSGGKPIDVSELPSGLHMLSSRELDDPTHPRLRSYLPRFRAATEPDPGSGRWGDWQDLLAAGEAADPSIPETAMRFQRADGFGTVSSSCIAIPSCNEGLRQWLYADGAPHLAPFRSVAL